MTTPDSDEIRRSYYQAELAGGVERFLEPRREDCPWCGSADLSVRLRTTDLFQHKPGRFTLERCGTCQHIFQNPRLTPAGLDFYYRDFYDGLGRSGMEKAGTMLGRSYRGRIAMLRPFTTPKAWLDVGTGWGHFCQAARKVWPDTIFDGLDHGVGIEVGLERGWLDRGYRGEFLPLAEELTGRYDVLSMHHYLEHTREPRDELRTAATVIPPGGYLLIELPDPEFRPGRLLGRFWLPWLQPQHQHMIPAGNLHTALADNGFSVLAVERRAAHQGRDLTGSVLLLLNACAPNPTRPWRRTEATRAQRVRHRVVLAVAWPLVLSVYALDQLLRPVVGARGNAYRVLARRDG